METEGLYRMVCDYIAGMTDRYLIEEYGRLHGSMSSAV
jgi:dGTPase